jgi:hypothetical protein
LLFRQYYGFSGLRKAWKVKKGESVASRRVIAFCRIEEWNIPLPCLCGRKGDFSSGRSMIVKRENNFSDEYRRTSRAS